MPLTRRHLLAACAAFPAACATRATCSATPVGDVPMRIQRGALIVPAALGRQPVLMILDTGAERTVLAPYVAQAQRYPEDPDRISRLYGVGGIMPPRHDVRVTELTFGNLRFSGLAVALGDTPEIADTPVVGLLGADVTGPLDLDFDFAAGRLGLYRVEPCTTDPVTWTTPGSRVPTRPHGALTTIEVHLDGTPLNAVIDTGASSSVIFAGAARRMGVAGDYMASIPASTGSGIGALTMDLHRRRFQELRIGPTTYTGPILAVGERGMGDLDMLIGLDILRLHRLWISPATQSVYVRKA